MKPSLVAGTCTGSSAALSQRRSRGLREASTTAGVPAERGDPRSGIDLGDGEQLAWRAAELLCIVHHLHQLARSEAQHFIAPRVVQRDLLAVELLDAGHHRPVVARPFECRSRLSRHAQRAALVDFHAIQLILEPAITGVRRQQARRLAGPAPPAARGRSSHPCWVRRAHPILETDHRCSPHPDVSKSPAALSPARRFSAWWSCRRRPAPPREWRDPRER